MEVANRRLEAQGLAGPRLGTVDSVVDRLLAIQAQDPRGARLAVRSRLDDPAGEARASIVDEALNSRQLVIGWLNRGTLHLVRSEDYHWLHALTAPRQATANRTRLRQEGVSEEQAERGVGLIVKRLADGPATRNELRDLLEAKGIPVAGQAMVHLLYLASIRGLIVRGPMAGKDQAFVLVRDWLGEPEEFDPEVRLPELARRYLVGHGPASDRDLAAWAGITLGQARKGLEAVAGELTERDGLMELKGRAEPPAATAILLLGGFDPLLHGWAKRDWIVPDASERGVVTTNGLFRPTILAGERIVGTWTMPGGRVELKPFGDLGGGTVKALEDESRRVVDYLAG